jgi:hypothetical protein
MSAVLDWPGEAELETGDCRIGSFSIDVFTAVGVVVPFIGLFLSSETHLVVKARGKRSDLRRYYLNFAIFVTSEFQPRKYLGCSPQWIRI